MSDKEKEADEIIRRLSRSREDIQYEKLLRSLTEMKEYFARQREEDNGKRDSST